MGSSRSLPPCSYYTVCGFIVVCVCVGVIYGIPRLSLAVIPTTFHQLLFPPHLLLPTRIVWNRNAQKNNLQTNILVCSSSSRKRVILSKNVNTLRMRVSSSLLPSV